MTPPPHPTEEPLLTTPTPAAITRRALAWTTLGLILTGGAIARLTSAGTTLSPTTPTRLAIALPTLTPTEATAALPNATPATLAALRSRRLHLVRAAFYAEGPAIGTTLTVTCGLTTQPITLSATPTPVLLPIDQAGTITLTPTTPMPPTAQVGLIAATGPGLLPPIPPGGFLVLDVIVL